MDVGAAGACSLLGGNLGLDNAAAQGCRSVIGENGVVGVGCHSAAKEFGGGAAALCAEHLVAGAVKDAHLVGLGP